MDSLLIKGGVPLHGEVAISGSKNAVLPILAATLLTPEPCVIRRVPDLSDVRFMGRILESLGAKVSFSGDAVRVQARKIRGVGNYNLIRKMRGSVCVLGPLLGRLHEATVSLPGGCVIGARPINLHLKGFQALGAKITIEGGYVRATARRLRGAELFLGGRAGSTVLGTANVMMAATLAEGVTMIESAACEPEVVDLANCLNAMGAKITGAGSPVLTITGVKALHGAEHEVIPDRIEAATYAIAAAATGGEVTLTGVRADQMHAVLDKLRDAGVKVQRHGTALEVRRGARLRPVDVTTLPYTGFPTDVQAQMMALMTLAPGLSIITERVFESRFMHVSELTRLGADIEIEGPSAIVKGNQPLSGAEVMASDLRASAALVIAGLAATGATKVNRVYHIDRGYENLDGKLRQLGARIQRVSRIMTKLLSLLIIVAVVFVGYRLYVYWEKVDSQRDLQDQTANRPVNPRMLPGMPFKLEDSLAKAEQGGVRSMRDWLNAYGSRLHDPRLAWIQLDYCTLLILDNPNEATRLFNAVKERTPTNSPVFPRVLDLKKTFQ